MPAAVSHFPDSAVFPVLPGKTQVTLLEMKSRIIYCLQTSQRSGGIFLFYVALCAFFLASVVTTDYNLTTKERSEIMMTQRLTIRPSKDLRTHYAQISAEAKNNPVAITVNGKEDTVILEHSQFMEQQQLIEDLKSRLAVYAHLAQAADDVRLGRVQPAHEAFADIISELRGAAK
jgi:PHD/YefM family antitoxin component YafN of YafNO toxin-antitoxin module